MEKGLLKGGGQSTKEKREKRGGKISLAGMLARKPPSLQEAKARGLQGEENRAACGEGSILGEKRDLGMV